MHGASEDMFSVDSSGMLPVGTKNLGSSTAALQEVHAARLVSAGVFPKNNDNVFVGGYDAATTQVASWWVFNNERIAPANVLSGGP